MADTVTQDSERIDCRDCGQMLAVRYPSGGLRPVVVDWQVTGDGRIELQCPRCGHRVRIRPRRQVDNIQVDAIG